MRRKITTNIFYRYFLSYILIFSFPLIILGSFLYINNVNSLKNEIEKSNIEKLTQIRNVTDQHIKNLKDIAVKISLNPRLTPYMVRNDSYLTMEAVNELMQYKTSNGITEEIILYFRGDDMIYSSAGSSYVSTFINDNYKFFEWNQQEFIDDINSIIIPEIKPTKEVIVNKTGKERIFIILIPIPANNLTPYATVLFYIRESVLSSMIENTIGDLEGTTLIINEDDEFLVYKSRDPDVSRNDMIDLIKNIETDGIHQTRFGSHKYSLACVRSNVSSWTFAIVMPTKQFFSRMIEMRTIVILILMFLVVVGIVSAVMMTAKQMNPIKSITERIKLRWINKDTKGYTNELEFIDSTFESIFDINTKLSSQIESNKSLVKDQFFTRLVKDEIDDPREVERLMKIFHFNTENRMYFVIVSLIDADIVCEVAINKINRVISDIDKGENEICHGIEFFENKSVAFIIGFDVTHDLRGTQIVWANKIQMLINQKFGILPAIGVGSACRSIKKVNLSFNEACAAIEYRFIQGKGRIIFFEDINLPHTKSYWYPLDEQIKFIYFLKQGDRTNSCNAFKLIMDSIIKQNLSVSLLKLICFDIINTILKVVYELSIARYFEYAEELINFDSLEDLEQKANNVICKICDYFDDQKGRHNIVLRKKFLDYLNENFTCNDMSLEKMSNEFQMSIYSVSRLFKEQIGVNFTEYLFNLRLEEVKKKLKDSNKRIKEIVNSVGYIDIPSFSRKFKQVEGITPGYYRKLYTK